MDEKSLIEELNKTKEKYGEYVYDIPLNKNIWTKGNRRVPHTRLKRVVQIAADLINKPISNCRVLDLGCLDGIFSIEFALQGAETVGVEIREDSIERAKFCKKALNLENLTFIQKDARDISVEIEGKFDVILCSGLLYHLTASDSIKLISQMYEMTNHLLIIDTHIALKPEVSFPNNSAEYWGKYFLEHYEGDDQLTKSKRHLASWENEKSFWFTRPSLINLLHHSNFSSVYECFNPAHLNSGKSGIEHLDRCTFVAIKGNKISLNASPVANNINEDWPENSLIYAVVEEQTTKTNGKKHLKFFLKKIYSKIKKLLK